MPRSVTLLFYGSCLLWLSIGYAHDYSHDDRHYDTLAFCAPLFSMHDALSDTVLGRPVYGAVNYVCGDF